MSDHRIIQGVDGRVPAEPASCEPSPAVSAASGFDPSREGLLARAAQRLRMDRVSYSPRIISPSIQANHVDGPVLHRLDGSMHWLTWRERFRVWRGKADAWSLEADQQRLEWLEGRMPCVWCDHFPFGQPPHAPSCRDSDRSGEADKTHSGLAEGESADPKGIAQPLSTPSNGEPA